MKNPQNIGFLSNTVPDPLVNHKATKPALNVGPYVGLAHFWGYKNLKIIIFLGGFRKTNILGGMKILRIFLGSSQNWTILWGVISMHFSVFLKVNVQNGNNLFGLLNFIYFCVMPDIPDIFLGLTAEAGSKPTHQDTLRIRPWGLE